MDSNTLPDTAVEMLRTYGLHSAIHVLQQVIEQLEKQPESPEQKKLLGRLEEMVGTSQFANILSTISLFIK